MGRAALADPRHRRLRLCRRGPRPAPGARRARRPRLRPLARARAGSPAWCSTTSCWAYATTGRRPRRGAGRHRRRLLPDPFDGGPRPARSSDIERRQAEAFAAAAAAAGVQPDRLPRRPAAQRRSRRRAILARGSPSSTRCWLRRRNRSLLRASIVIACAFAVVPLPGAARASSACHALLAWPARPAPSPSTVATCSSSWPPRRPCRRATPGAPGTSAGPDVDELRSRCCKRIVRGDDDRPLPRSRCRSTSRRSRRWSRPRWPRRIRR